MIKMELNFPDVYRRQTIVMGEIDNSFTVRSALLFPLQKMRSFNRATQAIALQIARFLTQNGSSRTQLAFWRMGAMVAAIGAVIAIVDHLITILALTRIFLEVGQTNYARLAQHAVGLYLITHVAVGLIRGAFEPMSRAQKNFIGDKN